MEDILPLNYYSDMCGIIADMEIINEQLKDFSLELKTLFEITNENYGQFIGSNFININLINIFTDNYIDIDTSLLIWDLLFIDGNIIFFKAFFAIFHYLKNFLVKEEQTIENFKIIIKDKLTKLKNDNNEFLIYLAFKEFKFKEEYIEEQRFFRSIEIAKRINSCYIPSKIKEKCDINNPYCLYKGNNNERIITCNVLQRKNKKCIDNYFTRKIKEKKDKLKNENKNEDDLLIERNVHHCIDKIDILENEISNNKNDKKDIIIEKNE